MNTEPLTFIREEIPSLFNAGVAALKAKAEGGEEKWKRRYEDVMGSTGAMRVLIEGEDGASVFLTTHEGELSAQDSVPDGTPIRMSFAVPVEALRAGLEEADSLGLLEDERAPMRLARTASAETEALLEGKELAFHLTFKDLPADPEEVTIRVGLGIAEPPTDATFTATISWDDVEDVREGDLTPQQLFGRIKFTGDPSQAMALGMTLMQRKR